MKDKEWRRFFFFHSLALTNILAPLQLFTNDLKFL